MLVSTDDRHKLKDGPLVRLDNFIFFKDRCIDFVEKHGLFVFIVKLNVHYK